MWYDLSWHQFHSCQMLCLWCFALWKVSKVTCCIKALWEQSKEKTGLSGKSKLSSNACRVSIAWKVEKSWWLHIFLSERLLILERRNPKPIRIFSFAAQWELQASGTVYHSFPYKHKRLQQKLLWGSADALDCLMPQAICRLSSFSVITDCQSCGEAGQRSPVELSSSLPSRPLMTVLFLVCALAWQPGLGVPLDNGHTQRNT